jgi:hypothetical protein
VPVYLMHFPIRGPASVRVEELKELKRASRIKKRFLALPKPWPRLPHWHRAESCHRC